MSKPLLSWKNLKVSFPTYHIEGGRLPSQVIAIPDGDVGENEFLWIDGPSGAGKSTLMHLIKGLIPQYIFAKVEGHFFYEDQDLTKSFPKDLDEKTVYVFQNPYSQIVTPRCKEEIIFSMENYGFSFEKIEAQSEYWAKHFQLEGLLEQKTYTLSGGQCQRLVLASSLACSPRILLFDEPTAFMDPQAQKSFYELLRKLKGQFTIIVIDHNAPVLNELCDKRLVWPSSKKENFGELPFLKKTSNFEFQCASLDFAYVNKQIFSDLTFKAQSGKIISIMGPNGSGKTTFFKILTSSLKPQRGEVNFYYEKEKVRGRKRSTLTSIIYQNSESQFYFDTVREELTFKVREPEFFIEYAKHLGLGNALERSPYLLSEGQKRRLSILIAVAQEKPFILYDEPTYGQDKAHIELITDLMRKLREANRLQILNTHDEAWAKTISDEIYYLKDHRLERL